MLYFFSRFWVSSWCDLADFNSGEWKSIYQMESNKSLTMHIWNLESVYVYVCIFFVAFKLEYFLTTIQNFIWTFFKISHLQYNNYMVSLLLLGTFGFLQPLPKIHTSYQYLEDLEWFEAIFKIFAWAVFEAIEVKGQSRLNFEAATSKVCNHFWKFGCQPRKRKADLVW